jgi:hypothetical protein
MVRIIVGLLALVVAILLVTYPESFSGLTGSDILACATFAIFVGMGLMGSEFFRTMIRRN